MKKLMPLDKWMLIVLLSFFITSCKTDNTNVSKEEINIWAKRDPNKLNPIVYPSSKAREIFQYILTPLADFHPESLKLSPILIKEIPIAQNITEGPYKGGIQFSFEFLEDSEWEDGTPITAYDYLFTIKAIKNPLVQAAGWRPFLKDLVAIDIDKNNSKKFEVVYKKPYMLAREAVCTINLFPAHIYDPNKSMDQLSILDLSSENSLSMVESDSLIVQFAKDMNGIKHCREVVSGAGPYRLVDWETDQFVILEQKENYWGKNYPEVPFLQANAKKLVFKIIKDENAALSLLKSGELDVLGGLSSQNFIDLQSQSESKYSFFTPQIIRTYYLLLNNQDPILKNKSIRKALAHVMDINQMIDNLENGMGTSQNGYFHSSKAYYNNDITSAEFNLEMADSILTADGWIDTDNNGIRDKIINKVKTELILEMLVSKRQLGRAVAIMLKEASQKVGIQINIETQAAATIIEKQKNKEYQITTAAVVQDAAPDDPYSKWHSKGPTNYSGFSNQRVDDIIVELRNTVSESKRLPLYLELQNIIAEEQAAIFLYSPKERIICSDVLNASATSKRPGYLANTFSFKKK